MNVRTGKRAGGLSSADVSSAGTADHAPDMSRAEALLRTVTGVADARIIPHPAGGIAVVKVHCTEEASTGQIVRNVRSALFAGCGIAISAECIEFIPAHEMRDLVAAAARAVVAAEVVVAPIDKSEGGNAARTARKVQTTPLAPAAQHVPVLSVRSGAAPSAPVHGIQIAKPYADSTAPAASHEEVQSPAATITAAPSRIPRILNIVSESAVEEQTAAVVAAPVSAAAATAVGSTVRDLVASAAALRLESVEVRRQSGRLRCRVVISLGSDHFGAVADSADPNAGEIHLAGRVACDALRAGGFTDARFDGAAVAQINGRQHVVVALSEWMGGETMVLSGAAPLEDVPERAAAIAAIKAVLAQDIN